MGDNIEVLNIAGLSNLYCILIKGNIIFKDWNIDSKPWRDNPGKVVILWGAKPSDPLARLSWHSALIEESNVLAFRVIDISEYDSDQNWIEWLKTNLGSWFPNTETDEKCGLTKGSIVKYPEEYFPAPAFLTVSPDRKLVEVLEQIDRCKRDYRDIIGRGVGEARKKIHESLDNFIVAEEPKAREDLYQEITKTNKFISIAPNTLPRILLMGESGVGKSLIAKYFAWRTSPDDFEDGEPKSKLYRPQKRIPIPDYLGREDSFEYDVFGFMKGAYTSAPKSGNRGFLLQNLGGVIFFDEIGDASPSTQAKLLAYLDDYMVVPRGWSGEGIFCPTMVIAATNQPLMEMVGKKFRNDLLQRFNVIINIPALNSRKSELPAIIDSLLQDKAVDKTQTIKSISQEALEYLSEYDYQDKNFRILVKILRDACHNAYIDVRTSIQRRDLPQDSP